MSTPELPGFDIARSADDDAGRVDLIDHARTQRADRRARIARHGFFHAGADERRLGLNQRHGLALHVRAHQRAVGVIVFQERNERGGNRNQLLGRNVHQRDVFARAMTNSPFWRAETSSSANDPSAVSSAEACATVCFCSSIAER